MDLFSFVSAGASANTAGMVPKISITAMMIARILFFIAFTSI